jgi:hypothetical protein
MVFFQSLLLPIPQGVQDNSPQSYRAINLTTMVCKQPEHIIAGYLSHVWDKNDWLCERQHGFRPGYFFENQVVTVQQVREDSLYKWVSIDAIIIDFSKDFDLVPHDGLFMNLGAQGEDSRVVVWVREFIE